MIEEKVLGLASAASAAVFWVICSLLIYSMPRITMDVTGDLVHADFTSMGWHMPFFGFFTGWLIWTTIFGLFGWMVGIFYNRFSQKAEGQ